MEHIQMYEGFLDMFGTYWKIKYRLKSGYEYHTYVVKAISEDAARKKFIKIHSNFEDPNEIVILSIDPTVENPKKYKRVNREMKKYDYVAVLRNQDGTPIIYVLDYVVVSKDEDYVYAKIRGIRNINLRTHGIATNGWVEFDNMRANRIDKIQHTEFEKGTIERLVWDVHI